MGTAGGIAPSKRNRGPGPPSTAPEEAETFDSSAVSDGPKRVIDSEPSSNEDEAP